MLYRSGWRERLPIPYNDRRVTAQRCRHPTELVDRGPHTSHAGPDRQFSDDDDLEPVYATISEITDSIDESSVFPAGSQPFHDLFHVFSDLAALPAVDAGDASSVGSSSTPPPPVLSDAPPPARRAALPLPIPGHVVDCLPHREDNRHAINSPPRFYTYC